MVCAVFFERDLASIEKAPERRHANAGALDFELPPDLDQRDVGSGLHEPKDETGLRLDAGHCADHRRAPWAWRRPGYAPAGR